MLWQEREKTHAGARNVLSKSPGAFRTSYGRAVTAGLLREPSGLGQAHAISGGWRLRTLTRTKRPVHPTFRVARWLGSWWAGRPATQADADGRRWSRVVGWLVLLARVGMAGQIGRWAL